jgi:hypothetical protein
VTLKQCILYSGTAKCRDISLFRLWRMEPVAALFCPSNQPTWRCPL